MTVYVVPRAPWHECVSEYLHYALDPGDEVRVVDSLAVPAEMALPGRVLAAPHLLRNVAAAHHALPRGSRCYESENLFANSDAARFSRTLRGARPDLRWEHYSPYQAAHFGEVARPPRLPALRPRIAPPPGAPLLFVGSINERRARVLQSLPQDRLRIIAPPQSVWGDALRAELACAAFVLNLRYYDSPPSAKGFYRVGLPETFRICFALDAGCPVLNEYGLDDLPAQIGLVEASYIVLAEAAKDLLDEHDSQGGIR